jgi:hypothetical protein
MPSHWKSGDCVLKVLKRLLSSRNAPPAPETKKVWRMNEHAPAGEWIDKSAPRAHTDATTTGSAESTGSGWLLSTMDLMKGADIAVVQHETDARVASTQAGTPSPHTADLGWENRRSLARELPDRDDGLSMDAPARPRPSPPLHRSARNMPSHDRRKPRNRRQALLRPLRGLLCRPLSLMRRDGQLHVVFVDRRKAEPLLPIRAELDARMRAYTHKHPDRSTRELFFVYVALDRQGWAGVQPMTERVLGQALAQAENLRGPESSDFLEMFIDRLRSLWLDAVHRDHHPPDTSDER